MPHRRPILWLLAALVLFAVPTVVFVPNWKHATTVVGVSIENQESARPHQRGLSDALMVEEWLVEGGITRFIALFDVNRLPPVLGPVRSLRPNLIEGALPWASAFFYAGGSPEAYDLMGSHPDVIDVNGLRGDAYGMFFRDENIAAPHNFFISGATIQILATEEQLPSVDWPPYKTGRPSGSSATVIELEFYNRLHNITYAYAALSGRYDRQNGLVEHQGAPVNVLIIEVPLLGTGELGRLDMPVSGEGPLLLFARGTVQKGFWKKGDTEEPFMFVDENGKPMIFAPGQTWLTSLPTLERVSWR